MNRATSHHSSFVLDRTYAAAPSIVFRAWSDPLIKARWFGGSAEWKEIRREMDFRVGGSEHLTGEWPGSRRSVYDGRFVDIVQDQRIVSCYEMHLDGARISVSLATVEFKPTGKPTGCATRLVYTEQAVFLDAFDDGGGRERGTKMLLDRLGTALTTD